MEIYIARQPIFDRNTKVIGYELLFRNSLDNAFPENEKDNTTKKLIANAVTIGFDTLINDKKAFVNFTEKDLEDRVWAHLSPDKVVVEILEDVDINDNTLKICKDLKEKGYLIALDDYIFNKDLIGLIDYIDIVKVDFLYTTEEEQEIICRRFKEQGKLLLAEKVESREVFERALSVGYDYFQGYFFSKPRVIKDYDLPADNFKKFTILKELSKERIDYDKLEYLIKSDISFTYKLMRYVNSAHFGFINNISSIKQAIVLLGAKEILKWFSLVTLSDVFRNDDDDELTKNVLIRARMCESIANIISPDKINSAFMVGLFSMLDIFMNRSMDEILKDLPINGDIKVALIGEQNILKGILDIVTSYENMQEENIKLNCKKYGFPAKRLGEIYIEALKWVDSLVNNL